MKFQEMLKKYKHLLKGKKFGCNQFIEFGRNENNILRERYCGKTYTFVINDFMKIHARAEKSASNSKTKPNVRYMHYCAVCGAKTLPVYKVCEKCHKDFYYVKSKIRRMISIELKKLSTG